MKKTLLAMAVLAASGASFAQSSVTLFGVVDATVAYGKGTESNKTQLKSSGYNSSRLGFRGVEDLGGGMNASFWLEAGLNNDSGAGAGTNTNNQVSGAGTAAAGAQGLTFNRRSTVSLGGNFGEVRLGRDYNPTFWNHTVYDPFGTNGVGENVTTLSNVTPSWVRASNSIGYFLPANIGGVFGQVQYAMGENASTAEVKNGDSMGLRVGYAAGPVSVAFAYGEQKVVLSSENLKLKSTNLGASYDFGMAKVMGVVVQEDLGGDKGKGFNLGVTAPVGAGEIRASIGQMKYDDLKAQKLALGYVHNLSKRTAIYTTVARLKNSGGGSFSLNGSTTKVNGSSTGLDLGVRHSF